MPLVATLLALRADPNAKDKNGYSALHIAASGGHAPAYRDVCALLLRHGARVNASDNDGVQPLAQALFKGHKLIIRELVAHGANPLGARCCSQACVQACCCCIPCRALPYYCACCCSYPCRARKQLELEPAAAAAPQPLEMQSRV